MMKHNETADDRTIKDLSAIQRAIKKEDFPEMEDPEGYAQQKQSKEKRIGKPLKEKKKEGREEREKDEKAIQTYVGLKVLDDTDTQQQATPVPASDGIPEIEITTPYSRTLSPNCDTKDGNVKRS
jgi:hypothetical protein